MQRFPMAVALGLVLALGCGGSDPGPAGRCQYQSSSSSGGICRIDLVCSGTRLAASCTDTDCVCILDDVTTGQHFTPGGFCALTEAEQQRLVEASCTLTPDAGA
jgi:hypothetical protein